jgi:hypothetical protein
VRREVDGMMQLLLVGVALIAIPAIGKVVRAMLSLIVRLVAAVFALGFVLLVLVAFAAHGKLI